MKKLNEGQVRQGDVLLVRIGEADEVALSHAPVVLKHGEATGHKHQFMAESRVSYPGRMEVLVGAPSALKHDEHTEAPVLPGRYNMPNQVEWTDADEPRVVAD